MFTKHNPVNMAIRHKHLKLEQTKIDRARRLLDVRTEQETVELALDMVIAEEAILRAHREVKGTGGVVDVFGGQRLRSSEALWKKISGPKPDPNGALGL